MIHKPLVIAHRGASDSCPENTLKAFQKAVDQGADGIELDIYLTRDRKIVVIHDEHVTNKDNKPLLVRKSTLEELQKVDAGEGEKIPTLREIFENFENRFSIINVEIKSTGYFTDGIEKELLSLIHTYHLQERIFVSSFNPLHLYRLKKTGTRNQKGLSRFSRSLAQPAQDLYTHGEGFHHQSRPHLVYATTT